MIASFFSCLFAYSRNFFTMIALGFLFSDDRYFCFRTEEVAVAVVGYSI